MPLLIDEVNFQTIFSLNVQGNDDFWYCTQKIGDKSNPRVGRFRSAQGGGMCAHSDELTTFHAFQFVYVSLCQEQVKARTIIAASHLELNLPMISSSPLIHPTRKRVKPTWPEECEFVLPDDETPYMGGPTSLRLVKQNGLIGIHLLEIPPAHFSEKLDVMGEKRDRERFPRQKPYIRTAGVVWVKEKGLYPKTYKALLQLGEGMKRDIPDAKERLSTNDGLANFPAYQLSGFTKHFVQGERFIR